MDSNNKIPTRNIFVFGSNLAGRHGAGAALHAARYFGAEYGRAVGLQGNSYAIPTKDANLKTLPLEEIKRFVDEFLVFAKQHWNWTFEFSAIGCGLAGYSPADIAPMLRRAPGNCKLPLEFTTVEFPTMFCRCDECGYDSGDQDDLANLIIQVNADGGEARQTPNGVEIKCPRGHSGDKIHID